MAVAVAIMELRGKEMSGREKFIWILVVFAFAFIGFKSIDNDHERRKQEQAAADSALQQNFDNLLGTQHKEFMEMLAQNQKHFESTMDRTEKIVGLSRQSLDQITGGGQYCYVTPRGEVRGIHQLAVLNSGALPLSRCFVIIRKGIPPKTFQDFMRPVLSQDLGFVPPGKNQGVATAVGLTAGDYSIMMTTRNATFYEELRIHPSKANPNSYDIRYKIYTADGNVLLEVPKQP